MKREIKFRGKTENGDWVYGTYHYSADQKHHYILKREKFIEQKAYSELHKDEVVSVIHESVGEYTGLKDKNGKEIYEGDIVKNQHGYNVSVSFGEHLVFKDDWGVEHFVMGWFGEFSDESGFTPVRNTDEIIGNIYENKDLIP